MGRTNSVAQQIRQDKLVTQEGLRNLQERLRKIQDRYNTLAVDKAEASEIGGGAWHDNAAIEEIEREQCRLLYQICELEKTIAEVLVIDNASVAEDQGQIRIGSKISITLNDVAAMEITLGGFASSDPANGVVSYTSPLGQALLGARTGDSREYKVCGRSMTVKVNAVH